MTVFFGFFPSKLTYKVHTKLVWLMARKNHQNSILLFFLRYVCSFPVLFVYSFVYLFSCFFLELMLFRKQVRVNERTKCLDDENFYFQCTEKYFLVAIVSLQWTESCNFLNGLVFLSDTVCPASVPSGLFQFLFSFFRFYSFYSYWLCMRFLFAKIWFSS